MYRQIKTTSAITLLSVALVLPLAANAGGYGATALRDGAVANRTAGAKVPCPRLGQNVPANLAAQMDCGSATPRVAGERTRNTGGGLFGGHQIGSAPPANSDDDQPSPVSQNNGPSDDGPGDDDSDPIDVDIDDGPTDGGDGDGGDGSDGGGDDGFTSKADRLDELGVTLDDFDNLDDGFKDSFEDFFQSNGPGGDWSGFNPDQ